MKENHALNKPVGIWIRVSTEDQARGESPQHHLERAKAYALSKGWNVVETYDLAGVSGKSVMGHPEAKRMLRDIKSGRITGLIFSKLARLARNTKELLEFSEIFKNSNADLISLQESIDTSTPAGRLFYTIIAAMAQWEREEIADRVKASISIRAKLGKPINGQSPYGYQWVDRKIVIHPVEAPIRRKAYELFLAHRRKGKVADILNAEGYRTRSGNFWHDTQINRILTESSAMGVYYYNRTRRNGPWQSSLKPESEWGKIECEAIVDTTLWNNVNRILEEQSKVNRKPGKSPSTLLGGLATCSCGTKMYVRSNSPKYVCRSCHNKIAIQDLEEIVFDDIRNAFGSPENVATKLATVRNNCDEKAQLLKAHEIEIQKIRDSMNQTHQLFLDGQITSQGFGQFYKPAEERLNQMLAKLPVLQEEAAELQNSTLSVDEIVNEVNRLYEKWPSLPLEDRRKIVESLVEKVVIGESDIDITYSHLPSSEIMTKSQQMLRKRSGSIAAASGEYRRRRRPF